MRYVFGDCELDFSAYALRRAGAEVHVEPQVFDLIACLVRAGGELVSYDGLIAEVWGGRIVSDATLAARISAARAALGDDGKRQAVIRTVPRRGVQLAVPVSEAVAEAVAEGGAEAAPAEKPLCDAAKRQVIRYTTSRDGTGIAWAETGEGPPLLRAGHWLSHLEHDWSSPVWRPLLDRLATGRRLIRYDPRGTGLSDRALGGASVEEFADDLEAVADAAGLDRFPVYAISQSVPIALTFAARRPERVSRLILLNGLVKGSTARGEAEKTETMVGMIRTGWAVPGSAFMRAVATLFMPRSTPEELASFEEMQGLSATADVAAELRRTIGGIDVSAVLDKVTCPALIMHCAGDAIQSPDQSKLLARMLPDAEFHLVDSPNHVVVPSDPVWGDCLDAFDRFLAAEA
ncbi:alpha/beta fold hydrolase [Psychromarinibacter sp. C21-152]|uniref:Alpha/beta fold hydrolase n=1 Tax=Psychromarinibacter sediminicola TaxID=3033385 RepID=A0AAE3NXG0_9RHOB|nr:alpha/beta fold hydrolase [Psychromarinibacter sediminicola]MDF0602730.1 alpha/beta fold hydrolase [Psychromarinibacter sediminicola]